MAESARSIAIEPDFRWDYRESARLALWTNHKTSQIEDIEDTKKALNFNSSPRGFHIMYHISTAKHIQLKGIDQKL